MPNPSPKRLAGGGRRSAQTLVSRKTSLIQAHDYHSGISPSQAPFGAEIAVSPGFAWCAAQVFGLFGLWRFHSKR